jgi:hypothetical protein
MTDWRTTFDSMVQSMRDLVAQIDKMPSDHVDEPLAHLRDGMRAALERYDKAGEKKNDTARRGRRKSPA